MSQTNLIAALALAAIILISSFAVFAPPGAHALDGNLYLGSQTTNEVKRYSASSGEFIDNFVTSGSAGLVGIQNLMFGPDGNLYVFYSVAFDPGSIPTTINRYDGTTAAFLNTITLTGSSRNETDALFVSNSVFGPDGNLYGIVAPPQALGEINRYDSTTGAFVDTFISAASGGLSHPTSITFGPDGNLYVGSIGAPIFGGPGEIKRYDGTTGAFIDTFVPESSGDLAHPTSMAFGPDGNLYVNSMGFEIKRHNGTTGAFIDTFIPAGAGGLINPRNPVFGPDENLYLISGNPSPEVKRYNGTTGAFIDTFVPAGTGGIDQIGGMAFATPPSLSTSTVNTIDLSGEQVTGVWTVIRDQDGTIVKTGFTPLTFVGQSEKQYKITVANYDGKEFVRWQDGESTNRSRTISLSSDMTLTAVYDTGDSLRGFTPLVYTGTEEQPNLTVNAFTLGEDELHMWMVIDPQSSNATETTYKVYATNGYQDLTFDHWEDGSTDRIRSLTISENTTIAAYYALEPQTVEFTYHDCGLSSAGCGVGTITCADGTTEGPGPISLAFGFQVSRNSAGIVDGTWSAVVPGAAGPSGASGTLHTLSFDGNTFETEGDLSGAICPSDPIEDNVAITFSGECGGANVEFEATSGTRGIIDGEIDCTGV